MFDLMALEAGGLLVLAAPLLAWTAWRGAWLVLPQESLHTRLAAAAVLAMTLVHVSVGGLGQLSAITGPALVAVLAVVGVAFRWLTPGRPRTPWRQLAREAPVGVALGLGVLGLAVLTARLLPIWQWDSFGYHLPFVNFVLQHHGFAEVPADLRYISTYPHNIELGMVWLRALLPDDRLVDLAQVPYGAAGAVLTAALARELGASRALSALAGACWLTVPLVFLQLPTNYVDVGTAATLLGAVFFLMVRPVRATELVLGGLALGFFLGSKPSAPLAAVVLGAAAVVRAVRAGQLRALGVMALVTLVFGAEQYAVMWVRHGNPVWPVAVQVGPWSLPGEHAVSELLAAGAALPSASGGVVERLLVSWLAVDAAPAFDMKLGGLGLTFLVALPLALLALVRRRAGWLVVALGVGLLSPDPSLGRYVLAFPALVLALAFAELTAASRDSLTVERWATAVAVLTAAWQLHHAWPGLVGDGPPWSAYLTMSDEERRLAVGPHGRPTDYPPTWQLVATGESIAFDADFEFPGLLWSPELRYPVYAVPRRATAGELSAFLERRAVKVAAVGERNRAVLAADPRWEPLFECRSAPCAVFLRRAPMAAR